MPEPVVHIYVFVLMELLWSNFSELYQNPNFLFQHFLNHDGSDFFSSNDAQAWMDFLDNTSTESHQLAMNDSQGRRYAFKVNITPLEQGLRILSFHDITESVQEVVNLKDKLVHDSLTEAFNRVYLAGFMQKIKFGQTNECYGMAILDIDFFKNINDKAGHLAGDNVLKELVSMLNKRIRKDDFLIRWGGEEFIIIFTNITSNGLSQTAENLRLAIEGHDFGIEQPVTCSFGLTMFDSQELLESIIERTDHALYKAKNSGRNKTVCELKHENKV